MISQEIKHLENDKVLLFAISSDKIGGAERRIINLAHQVLNLTQNFKIQLITTQKLYEVYCKDTQLAPLINNEQIHIYVAESFKEASRIDSKNKPQIYNLLKKSITLIKRLIKRLAKRFSPFISTETKIYAQENNFDKFNQLKNSSWFQQMLKITSPGDHVHCFFGSPERNGAILLSQHDRQVVVEITSNRIIPLVIDELRCLIYRVNHCPNLHFQCVSKTVYSNFIAEIGSDFLEKYQISCGYYKKPCLPLETLNSCTSTVRENIIVFGHRFVAPKNGILFARVVSDMYKRGELSNWKVHFRGLGPEEEAIKHILADETVASCVDIGWSHDLEGELQRSKIFISIIATGSYPSQSVFQSMRNGNLIVLGDAGETVEQFAHENIYFTKIEKDAIRTTLLKAMADANDSATFSTKSDSMKQLFKTFSEESTQAKELLSLHLASEKILP